MKEKSRVFWLLLSQIPKIDAEEKLQLITIASLPHMEKDNASSIINRYKVQSMTAAELLEEDDDFSNLEKLKGAFNGK